VLSDGIACGDLRNVIRTINNLPGTYDGSLRVIINDLNPLTVVRSFMILECLRNVEEKVCCH
jgi:hypothetical protein